MQEALPSFNAKLKLFKKGLIWYFSLGQLGPSSITEKVPCNPMWYLCKYVPYLVHGALLGSTEWEINNLLC